ncbi:MAG: phytanoyl-CoA dioxygenase family protein [Gammaproteobacteria bacterium]|nr:phytanoyl-CoA dioxygenase family protein [Gammaproteobacteria bacterium]
MSFVLNQSLSQTGCSKLRVDFDRDGFVVIKNFLSPDEVGELVTQTEACLDTIGYKVSIESSSEKSFGGTKKNLQHVSRWFDQELRSGKPYQFVKNLLGTELKPATAAYFERIPGEQAGIEPHFDSIGHRNWGATIWIALDSARISNGCLYYAAGSHRVEYPNEVGIEDFDKSGDHATAIEIDPGDAAIHSSRTVHWSNPNQSLNRRRAISFFYWSV